MGFETYRGEPDIHRLFDAFKHRKIDRVPNFEVLIEDSHVEKILGRYAGNTLAIGGDPAKGVEESEGARPMHAKDYLELCEIIGQDAMIVEAIWTPFKLRHEDGTLSLAADRSIKSRRDFEQRIQAPTGRDIEDKMQYVREYRRVIDESDSRVGFCVLIAAYFQTLYEFMIGMEDCMTLVYKDRDFIEELLEISGEYWEKFVKRALEEGVDFIWVADDVAFKTGLFLPPKIMKTMWLPHLQRIIEPAVNSGTPVMFHSDGKIDDIVPWLVGIGVDCIQPMDPYGIDYRDYKKRFGNLVCLAGNIDIEFPLAHGTPEDVERDVKEHMEVLKPGGGYVATSSHSIVNYIPHDNFIAMINAIHRYGSYEGESWALTGDRGVKAEAGGAREAAREVVHEDRRGSVRTGALQSIFDALYRGDQEHIVDLVQDALDEGNKPVDIIDGGLTPAIREVGEEFSTGELFLPDLLLAAHTMQAAMGLLTPLMERGGEVASRGKVLIGTVKGDLHDIGKNMVIALLKGNGFEVVDLGIDNAPGDFVSAAKEHEPDVIGYSGLLTTTLAGIPEQIMALQKEGIRDKVLTIVGGAPVTEDFAARNGIDLYGKDANVAVQVIDEALRRRHGGKGI
jgi:5-methyltetrahydrofolate--homocysteine methyltransferase